MTPPTEVTQPMHAPPAMGEVRRPPSLWIARPWVDLVVGCGGWSLPLLAIAYVLSDEGGRDWSGAFYALALVTNYPHYMATVYRAYGAADRASHRLYTIGGTAALVCVGLWVHTDLRLLPALFTAYVMWSPWHYSGQNYGLLMMFAKRAGLGVTNGERRRLRIAFVASYLMLLASFNAGPSADPLVLSLGLSTPFARAAGGVAGAVFAVVGVTTLISVVRRATTLAAAGPVLLLYVTQGSWFVAPIALAWAAGIASPQTRYSSGILAVMHSAQYLWVTQYYARREQGAAWMARRYWIAVVVGGMALFLPVPWLASYLAHADFTASVLIVAAIVNLHHFMIDGVVWKLRNPRVAETLTGAPMAEARRATPLVAGGGWRRPMAIAGALALVCLAVVDQWRYRLALRDGDPVSLEAAMRLNPYDGSTQGRLVRTLMARGDSDALRAHFDWMIARRPDDADARVNAGVLARQTGRVDDAVRFWEDALARQPAMSQVHLYLAEALDEQDRTGDAVRHYRAYVDRVAVKGDAVDPDPATLVPVLMKFADALARSGQIPAARAELERAAGIAKRAGMTELEAAARERLSTL